MSRLKVYALGSPQIELDGSIIHIRRNKALALALYLAVTGKHHRRDALADLLWPDRQHSRARASLRRELSALRTALSDDWLDIDREVIGMHPDIWLDVTHFQQYIADCVDGEADSLALLTKATDIYRDDFLTGFTLANCPDFDEWQFFQSEGLRQQLAQVLERLIALHIGQHDFETAIPYTRRWLVLDPYHEFAHQQLMRLYAWGGQWAAALRQFKTCEKLLVDELGVQPSEETQKLNQAIKLKSLVPPTALEMRASEENTFAGINVKSSDVEATRLESKLDTPKSNLPEQPTPFIGRETELAALDDLMADAEIRLVTIVGPGGMGKTRLAVTCGGMQLERLDIESGGQDPKLESQQNTLSASSLRFPNGVFFVSLAPLSSIDHILPTMAEALGFQLESGGQTRTPKQQLLDYLRQKQMLLVMDNFEHLLEGVEILADILQAAPNVKILATSRERLHLHEEQVYPIQGLEFPDWETSEDAAKYTAIRLFLQSAQRVQPNFVLVSDDLIDLTRICRQVEGMPLGIELAASWVDTLSLADIAIEIQQSLDFLETEVRNIPARHRSIRAVFDYTWQRMKQIERNIFAQLSIFRGGFTRQAAQQITGASIQVLGKLTSKSLIQYKKKDNRYQIHELLRQYGADQLAENSTDEATVRNSHSAYYTKLLYEHEPRLRSVEQLTALAEIEVEIENMRLAWDWAVECRHTAHISRAIESLGQFYEWYGRYQEGENICRTALTVIDENAEPHLWIRMSIWQATFHHWQGHSEEARILLKGCLTMLDDPTLSGQDTRSERAAILLGLGQLDIEVTDHHTRQDVVEFFEQSLALYKDLNDGWGMVKVMTALCPVVRHLSENDTVGQWRQQLEKVEHLAQQSITLCRETGNQAGLANAYLELAMNSHTLGYPDKALSAVEACIELCLTGGIKGALVKAYAWRGLIPLGQGNYAQARDANQLTYDLAQEIGYYHEYVGAIRTFGMIALAEGQYDEARHWLQDSVPLYQEMDLRYQVCISLSLLGIALHHLGNVTMARQHLIETLQTTTKMRAYFVMTYALCLAALQLAHRGRIKRAVEIYSMMLHLMLDGSSHYCQDIAGMYVNEAASTLPSEEVAAAKEQGRNLQMWPTAEALLQEFS